MEWHTYPIDFPGWQRTLERVAAKKASLDAHRPLYGPAVQSLRETMALEWTYHSNAIEGNTLSLQETRVVIEDGMTVRGKSLREHFEAINHHEAIAAVEQLARPGYVLTSADVLDVHALMMHNLDKAFAGRYRNAGVRIAGADFTPPNALKVEGFMENLLDWTQTASGNLHPMVRAAVFHHRLVWIHPFFDGNGRTARLLTNLLLLSDGYPPAVILKNDRLKYYEALNRANREHYGKWVLLLAQSAERSLDLYLGVLNDSTDDYLPLSDLVNEPGVAFGMEYLSLLARQGKIDAYKDGRNWHSTKKAVMDYVENRERKR